jgi:hypothetical protein
LHVTYMWLIALLDLSVCKHLPLLLPLLLPCCCCCCFRVFNAHEDWVEGLLVCQGSSGNQDAFDQSLYSFSADGHVCSWELDAEQNCDVYRLVVSVTAAMLACWPCVHIPVSATGV